jgi:hypothetical protein
LAELILFSWTRLTQQHHLGAQMAAEPALQWKYGSPVESLGGGCKFSMKCG